MQLLPIAAVVAVVAAIRSTWSPCGWSMLSTLVPLSERSRGHRWPATAAWFVLGAAVGGVALGGLGALAALGVDQLGLAPSARAAVGGTLLVLGAVIDGRALGPALPHHRRQVDEEWLDEFRPWVYAGGFGLQIGAGLATYIMTTGVYLVVALGAATASPAAALVVGAVFGTVRGTAILAGRRLDDPARLARFHRRFAAADEPVRLATTIALAGAAAATLALAFGVSSAVAGGVTTAIAAATLAGAARRSRTETLADGTATAAQRGAIEMRPNAAFRTSTDVERRSTEPTTA